MLNPRRVLPNDLIYDRVWGYDFNLSRQLRCGCTSVTSAASSRPAARRG